MKPLLCLASLALASIAPAQTTIQRIAKPDATGAAASVRVADVPLVFTSQITAPDTKGDAREQADQALNALAATLEKSGSDLTRVVRLNASVADDRAIAAVEAAVAARFAATPPACTFVRTSLANANALVTFDAVAVTSRVGTGVEILPNGSAIMPAGGKIFISGQAEKGADLGTSSRLTMEKLFRAVAHLGLTKADVVQVKAFIRPFADHAAAAREIAASFDGKPAPPVVQVEWQSDLFTEIELVVSAKSLPPPAGDNISFAFLPWLTRSPRFCHVAHIAAGTPLIFVGEIDGGDAGDARAQLKTIFARLGSVLFEAGSSYRNLAKATYYLADPKAQALLGDIRGVYFDPQRPPAASAIHVTAPTRTSRAASLDIVAVPVGK